MTSRRVTKVLKSPYPIGVVFDQGEMSVYRKKENPRSPVGEERFYFLHPNLPAYGQDHAYYLVPELGERCKEWRLAFQVGDSGWYHQAIYSMDPTDAHILDLEGGEHRLPTRGKLDFFTILNEVAPSEPGTTSPGELTHLSAAKTVPYPPKDANAGFLLMVMEMCGLVNPDVVVIDLKVPEGFEVTKIPIGVRRLCMFVDRTLKDTFATSDHPAFGGKAVLADLVVANEPYLESVPRDRVVLIITDDPGRKDYDPAKKIAAAYMAYPEKRSPEKSPLVVHTVYDRFVAGPPFVVTSLTDPKENTKRYSIRGSQGVWRAHVDGHPVYLPDPTGYALNLIWDLVDEAEVDADFWSMLGAVRYLGLTVNDSGGSLKDYVASLRDRYNPEETGPELGRKPGVPKGKARGPFAPKGPPVDKGFSAPKGGPKGGPRVFKRPGK